jgi:hypothetical protein
MKSFIIEEKINIHLMYQPLIRTQRMDGFQVPEGKNGEGRHGRIYWMNIQDAQVKQTCRMKNEEKGMNAYMPWKQGSIRYLKGQGKTRVNKIKKEHTRKEEREKKSLVSAMFRADRYIFKG